MFFITNFTIATKKSETNDDVIEKFDLGDTICRKFKRRHLPSKFYGILISKKGHNLAEHIVAIAQNWARDNSC